MLDLTAWAERISTAEVQASLAADVDAARKSRTLPSVVVVPGREAVTVVPMTQGSRHKIVVEVLVVTGVSRGNQPLGGPMVDQLSGVRRPVLQRLVDWMPPPFGTSTPSRSWYDYFTLPVLSYDTEVAWHGGQLLSMSDNAMYWVDAFRTEYWWTP